MNITTHAAAALFLSSPENNLRTESSLRAMRGGLKRLDDRPLEGWSVDDLVELCYTPCAAGARKGQPPADKTVRCRKYHFTAFFSWCEFKGLLDEDPARHLDRVVRPGNTSIREKRWLSEPEVAQVLASVDTSGLTGRRDEIILRLGFGCGLRRDELTKLTWGQLDLEAGTITLVGKGRKIATVKMQASARLALIDWHATATAALGRRPEDEESVLIKVVNEATFAKGDIRDRQITAKFDEPAISGSMIGKVCQSYAERSGIEFAPHDMRRTFCGILSDRGVPLGVIRDAMRHESEAMTTVYLQDRPDKAAKAMEDIHLNF